MNKPWENEPDREEFKHVGFDCLLNRNPMGAWCGYVAVPESHRYYGKHYSDFDDTELVNVHGGLTYANECQEPICHVVKEGENDKVWWFGFDCAHWLDLIPKMEEYREKGNLLHEFIAHGYREEELKGTYRNINYVRQETKDLAEQLRAIE